MRLSKMAAFAAVMLCFALPGAAQANPKRFPGGAVISVVFEQAGIAGSARITRRKAGERTRFVTVEYVPDEPVIINESTFTYFSIGIMDPQVIEMDQHCDYRIVVDWKRTKIVKSTLLPTSFELCNK